ncbi:4Fe-4S ferredoxin [Deltaproteobacteria bacterium Smac51]|nr:4Fe-4S ferredoxin [Deltaproteobacteria bacterium Smac51]
MKISKIHSVVFSPCGGTLNMAGAITRNLKSITHDLTRPSERKGKLSFDKDDLVFFAFPVYGGRVPTGSAEIFDQLNGRGTPAVLAAVYGNREYEGALIELEKLSVQRGFKPVAAVAAIAEHSIEPEVAAGRPDASDQQALADFGRKIYDRLTSQPDLDSFNFEAPGFVPDRPAAPSDVFRPSTDQDKCSDCGLCVPVCPTAAISGDRRHATSEDCIGCMACLKVCPESARVLTHPKVPEVKAWLKSITGERKEVQTFF